VVNSAFFAIYTFSYLFFGWFARRLIFYDVPERSRFVSAEELAYITSDREEVAGATSVSWLAPLRSRQTWASRRCGAPRVAG
jgi:MFS transporter, ACS family, hexuronate transporter